MPRTNCPRHFCFWILSENMTLWYGGAEFGIIVLLFEIYESGNRCGELCLEV